MSGSRSTRDGWKTYSLPPIQDNEATIAFVLTFEHERLREVGITLVDPTKYGRDWNDWSPNREYRRTEDTLKWLKSKGYEPGTYAWGQLWCDFDPRSGAANAGVRFA